MGSCAAEKKGLDSENSRWDNQAILVAGPGQPKSPHASADSTSTGNCTGFHVLSFDHPYHVEATGVALLLREGRRRDGAVPVDVDGRSCIQGPSAEIGYLCLILNFN